MSYFLAYVLPEPAPPVDGDNLASAKGWLQFGDWVVARSDEFPEAAHLAQEGWVEDGEDGAPHLADLEEELSRVPHAAAPEDVAAIAATLLAAVKARPDGCVGVLVTDGEPPGDDQDDEDQG